MGITISPIVYVFRGGNNHFKYGDDFQFSGTIIESGPKIARIVGFSISENNIEVEKYIIDLCNYLEKIEIYQDLNLQNKISDLCGLVSCHVSGKEINLKRVFEEIKAQLKNLGYENLLWERVREDGTFKTINIKI